MPQSSADLALAMIPDGALLGLGTGKAAKAFVDALGARVKQGLKVRGVPTSEATAEQATKLGIPLVTLADVGDLDIAFDGADEVDPHCQLIKGYGGALVREKIVEASAKKLVILVGPEKVVKVLGERGRLPVEVVPFGLPLVKRRLKEMGFESDLRMAKDKPYITDNGNLILDLRTKELREPARLDTAILAIPGVVGTGLFVNMADTVLIQHPDRVEVRAKPQAT